MKNEMNAKQLDLNEMDMVSGGADGQQPSGNSDDYSDLDQKFQYLLIFRSPLIDQPML